MGAKSRFIFGVPLALALFASLLLPSAPARAMSANVCGVLCAKDPVPPPRPAANCGSYCPPARPLPVDATLSGTVRDVLGGPVTHAAVYWTYGLVWTDSAGRFSITVWADQGQVKLTADHDLFL
ncbi:MAG: hypothetical protein HY775_07360 [Acidobacteria bacterium]|nr:hypothetical protein [Acidobacteriota bacterium]